MLAYVATAMSPMRVLGKMLGNGGNRLRLVPLWPPQPGLLTTLVSHCGRICRASVSFRAGGPCCSGTQERDAVLG